MKPRFCNHLQNGAVVASLNMPTLSKLKKSLFKMYEK